ncbi:MAG TPA: hypothetical protein VGM88_03745 [Kofleriaceae bacterium]
MDERRTRMGIGVPEAPPDEQASLPEAHVANRDAALAHVTPRTSAKAETISRTFLGISLKRAYRLNIAADEVLPAERAHLESRAAHITDPDQQAFLAWRRSVLLLVAMMFVPLCVFRFLEAFDGPPIPAAGRAFVLLPAIAEAIFCLVMFDQLKHWAEWKRQRRVMFYAWCIYFIAPFIVYAYPFRTAFDHSVAAAKAAAEIGGIHLNPSLQTVHIFVGLAFGVQALLALGPKVISLMPGLIRASIVTKLQFPGSTAPGWLMMLAAPFYALFAYIIVLLPYQITGSWQFVVGNLGVIGAQVFIGTCGRKLTVPLSQADAAARIHKYWLWYIIILVVSVVFMVYGLYTFIAQLHFGVVRVITGVLATISNVLLDTLIGTDAIITAMAYFRRRGSPDPQHVQMLDDAEKKLDVFTS